MSNYIRQNEGNVAKQPLKVEKPLLESSSQIDKITVYQYRTFPRDQNYRAGDKLSASEFCVMESFNWLSLGQLEYLLKKPKIEIHGFTKSP